jgi:hypothetical protein
MSDRPPRKRGRPPKTEGRAKPGLHVAVPRDLADQLLQIATRENLLHGPFPSRTLAIRWLVDRDATHPA